MTIYGLWDPKNQGIDNSTQEVKGTPWGALKPSREP